MMIVLRCDTSAVAVKARQKKMVMPLLVEKYSV